MVVETINWELTEELKQLRSMVRDIVDNECIPIETEYLRDEEKEMEPEHLERLTKISKESGIWDAHVPKEFGGGGMGALAGVIILEEASRSAVAIPRSPADAALYECNEQQRPIYLDPVIKGEKNFVFALTEPSSNADPVNDMQTRAVLDGDTWVINGRKFMNTNHFKADFVTLLAVTDPNNRRNGITMFLVDLDSPGITPTKIRTWMHEPPSRAPAEVVYEDVRVPASNVLGEVGRGFRVGQKWLTTEYRLQYAGRAMGRMSRSLDICIDWVKNRTSSGRPLATRQAIQWMIVDMYVWLEALRTLVYRTAWRSDHGHEEDAVAQGSLIKLLAGQWGFKCMDNAMQIMGGVGQTLDLPINKFFRQSRHDRISGGTDEMHKRVLARSLLGREMVID